MGRRAKPAKVKAEAKRPLARKVPTKGAARVHALEKRLAEALEQQAATSELLKVIGRFTFDLQPVFETLAENAVRLCEAERAFIFRFDGRLLRTVATFNASAELKAFVEQNPIAPGRHSGTARAALERRTVHILDVLADPEYSYGAMHIDPIRTVLGIPMLRAGELLGVFMIYRLEVRGFTESQIALMETFADQAVIAIESVRLFTELEARNHDLTEALEQQTATAEILRVISGSPTDVQPVFDTIVRNAVVLCEALFGAVFRFDGELIHLVAHHNFTPEVLELVSHVYPMRPNRGQATGRVILSGDLVHLHDALVDGEYYQEIAIRGGWRSMLAIPMSREGTVVGVIWVARAATGPFPDNQIALLKTFADQAVIAIENVRLFTELQQKNEALTQAHGQVTEALDQQTVTAEILRLISSSPSDVQPTFDAIAANATRLCGAVSGMVFRFDGELIHVAAYHNVGGGELDEILSVFPIPPGRGRVTARAILTRAIVHVEDLTQDPEYAGTEIAAAGFRTLLAVPMLRDGAPIGAILVARMAVAPFSAGQIELLETFADQAVIAIENVRLFTELQAKNQALTKAHAQVTEALEQQTATAEILRAISRSQTDALPVFDAIVDSAMQLLDPWGAEVFLTDGQSVDLAAIRGGPPGSQAAFRERYPRPLTGQSVIGGCITRRTIIHIADIESDPIATAGTRHLARARGARSLLVVPMLRGDDGVGAISVTRTEPGGFSKREVEMLQTFAAQAVIAIENVRLFKELEARTAELTRSVDQLTALGEVGRAVSSTLDLDTVLTTIVSRAVQLAGVDGGTIWEYDETSEEFVLRTTQNVADPSLLARTDARLRKGEGAVGRLAITREPVQIADITTEGAYEGRLRDVLFAAGTRALLAVPLVHEDHVVGGFVVSRRVPGEFAPEVVDLMKTFATQSALAIQNARLFQEIQDKGAQLQVANRHKDEFLANMSHELRTPLNGIIGFSEVMLERMFGGINEKQEEYLKDILESGRHLLALINDILDLSKIEAGKMELELTDFDVPTAIDNALTLIRERANRRGQVLERTVDRRLTEIRGDERKFKQILLNLLSNAVKFTPEGGRIEVRAGVADGHAEISVTDTGVGIAPEDHDAVFEEFHQVGRADKKAEGTGLGLALCRKFVELHGGRIWVKSQVGTGSTFTFTIPVRREPSDRGGLLH